MQLRFQRASYSHSSPPKIVPDMNCCFLTKLSLSSISQFLRSERKTQINILTFLENSMYQICHLLNYTFPTIIKCFITVKDADYWSNFDVLDHFLFYASSKGDTRNIGFLPWFYDIQ